MKEWKKERDALTAKKASLVEKYYNLRVDIKDAEMIKRRVKTSINYIAPELYSPQKRRSMDLER